MFTEESRGSEKKVEKLTQYLIPGLTVHQNDKVRDMVH